MKKKHAGELLVATPLFTWCACYYRHTHGRLAGWHCHGILHVSPSRSDCRWSLLRAHSFDLHSELSGNFYFFILLSKTDRYQASRPVRWAAEMNGSYYRGVVDTAVESYLLLYLSTRFDLSLSSRALTMRPSSAPLALPHPSASMEGGCTALSLLMSFSFHSHQSCPR